ncbi:MAG: cyclohydrolase [Frankiales bacterium]|nr:cyclohydrolase [Frankiales bacterium]
MGDGATASNEAAEAAPLEPVEAVRLDPVEAVIADVAAGRAVIVLDDDSATSAGELIFAAALADADLVSFAVRHTSGYLCVAVPGAVADRLALPAMPSHGARAEAAAFTVTVDAAHGISTGISAADRAYTIRLLADPATQRDDLSRPGHVLPVRAQSNGLLDRFGHTEAAMDLAILAGLSPAGVLAELVSREQPLAMAQGAELRDFADEFGLSLTTITELVRHRRAAAGVVEPLVRARVPLPYGPFEAVGYAAPRDGREHVAFTMGELDGAEKVLVRVHTECLLGDVFGSQRCRCAQRLTDSLAAVAAAGRGVVVYLRGRERRDAAGAGLLAKLMAYEQQDAGRLAERPEWVHADGDFDTAAQVLDSLGIRSVRLLADEPADAVGLRRFGVRVVDILPESPTVTAS